jgi:23S rRNA (cytosine1962-C5)-methyltransferase
MLDKLLRALELREPLRSPETDALRLVDGPGDGFDDLEVDDFAGRWLVQTRIAGFPEWLRNADARSIYWKKLGDKTSPIHLAGEKITEPFVAHESGVKYWIDFSAGYSQGIFLDQRDNRAHLHRIASGKSVLNCFAYTCAFGVSAALGGAQTVNCDLSRNYLDWGRRNYTLNGLDPAAHEFLQGDVFDWLKRLAKKDRKFDLVILDPPTFSRDEKGRIFRVENDFPELVRSAAKLLHAGGTLFCSTNQRSLWLESFRGLIEEGLANPKASEIQATPMPADFRGEKYLKTVWVKVR